LYRRIVRIQIEYNYATIQWIRTSTGQTKGHVPSICLPQGDPQQYTPATQTEACALPGCPLGSLPSCIWPLKAPGSTVGRVAKPLISPLTTVPPFNRQRAYDFLLIFHSNYGSISCRFWDIQCWNILWPWNPSQEPIKVTESGTIRQTDYRFLLVF